MTKNGAVPPAPPLPRAQPPSVMARGPLTCGEHFSVVGIGASAGGLDVCRKLLDVLPADTGMAFILIQTVIPRTKV